MYINSVIASDIQSTNTLTVDLKEKFQTLTAKESDNSTQLSTLKVKVKESETICSGLQGTLGDHAGELSDLHQRSDRIWDKIGELISTSNTNFEAIEALLTTLTANITAEQESCVLLNTDDTASCELTQAAASVRHHHARAP